MWPHVEVKGATIIYTLLHYCPAGWLIGRLVNWLVGWSVSWLVGRSLGVSPWVGRSVISLCDWAKSTVL